MYRQGDLLIVSATIPANLRVVADGVVELGEATGHAHVLEQGEVMDGRWQGKYLRSNGASRLVHDEHETIVLPEGEYRVIRQRQHEGDNQWSDVID